MLTYQDRLKEMRKTKIEHTLGKRGQQGYMDADDYGTVPVPDDFHFEPISDREDKGFCGVQGMCDNFCKLMDEHPLYLDPMEILCGRWRVMLTTYRGSTGETRWDNERFPYDHLKPLHKLYDIDHGMEADSHLSPDFNIGLSLGWGGLLEKIDKYAAINTDKKEFYDAERRTVKAIQHYISRHIPLIEETLAKEDRPEIRRTLEMMLEANRNIVSDPPKTLLEACQWMAHYSCVTRIYDRDGAGCQLDSVLYPYYEKDLREGRITKEDARFMLANLLLIDPHYHQLAGVDENGKDRTNELSYLILDAAHDLNISANLTIRVHPDCDPGLVRYGVEYLFSDRNGWPRFAGDKQITEGYMRNEGVTAHQAANRLSVGCNWSCVTGREFPMNDCVKINLAKVFEVAFYEEMEQPTQDLEHLYQLFLAHTEKAIAVTAEGINLHVDHVGEVTPELVINPLMYNSIETGLDCSLSAELHTLGIDGCALAVVADSLAAIEQRVVNEKLLTWQQLADVLRSDFEGTMGERIRLMLSTSPRYCQGGTIADRWAERITEDYTRLIKAQSMPEGRTLVPGFFSWSRTIQYGATVGATPNGRKARAPISHGANPNPGFRKDGAATAMATGIAHAQPGYGNAAPLQLEFDPKMTREEGGVERVEQLIRTHIDMGGTLININVLDGEKLKKANENPDLYPDLVVRVTGFTAYFATLSPEFRQLVMDRFVEGI